MTYDITTLPPRIRNKITIDADTGCWVWQASKDTGGYGQTSWMQEQKTHRSVYRHYVGEIEKGLVLDHLCRQRACCNPEHLDPVTQQVNTQRGKVAKLTPIQVLEIREWFEQGEGVFDLVDRYNVSALAIVNVLLHQSWNNIGGPRVHGDTKRMLERYVVLHDPRSDEYMFDEP